MLDSCLTLNVIIYNIIGYLSSNSGIEGMAFIRSKLQASRKRYPDIQLVTSSILLDNADNAREIYNFKEEVCTNRLQNILLFDLLFVISMVLFTYITADVIFHCLFH